MSYRFMPVVLSCYYAFVYTQSAMFMLQYEIKTTQAMNFNS